MRIAGIAMGLALAALLVLALRVPASSNALGAGIRLSAAAPGELHVPDEGAFLAARNLTPGGRSASAELPVTNVTRGPGNVRLRAAGGAHDLDAALHLELRAGGRRLASGPLRRLRGWSRPLRVERGAERTIRVRAWLPAGSPGTEGRRVAADLELSAQLVRGSR